MAYNSPREVHVTRLEVIDETGRILVINPCSVELSWQDNERTLKVFVTKPKENR